MLKEHLNIETNLRVVQTSVWFDEAVAGNFDLTISAIVSTLMDPSDYFTAWYGKDGPQNYSQWINEPFHALVPQIEQELDDDKRKAMIRQAERSSNRIHRYPRRLGADQRRLVQPVRGQNPSKYFGIYDVVRWDQVWLPGLGAGSRAAVGSRA